MYDFSQKLVIKNKRHEKRRDEKRRVGGEGGRSSASVMQNKAERCEEFDASLKWPRESTAT